MMRSSIDPIVPGIRTKVLDAAKGRIVVLHIPRSWAGPHMVTVAGDSRFYSRSSVGKRQLDVHEIRSAFLLSADVAKRIRQFRDERLGRLVADETPVMLKAKARLALHLLPFTAMGDNASIDLAQWAKGEALWPMATSGCNYRYNLDGYLWYSDNPQEKMRSYVQLFRSGVTESVMALEGRAPNGTQYLHPSWLEQETVKGLGRYLRSYEKRGIELPFAVTMSLVGVNEGTIYPSSTGRFLMPELQGRLERDVVLLPDILVRDYREHPATLMRPAFDALWQGFGLHGSLCYDENGNWDGLNFRW